MNRFDNHYKELYKNIVETATEGIWVSDTASRTLFVNKQLTEMFGYSADEMIGKEAFHFFEPGDVASARKSLLNRISGENEQFVRKYVRKDGSSFWASVSASSITDESGNTIALLGMLTDVTAQKEAHEKIRLSEQLYSMAFRDNPVAMAISKLEDGTIVDINDSYSNMLGWTREETIGNKALNLSILDDPEKRKIIIDEVRNKKEIRNYEINLHTKYGTVLKVLITVKLLVYENEQVLLSIMEDVTRLKETEQRYNGLFNNKTSGVTHCQLVTNNNGTIDFNILKVNDTYSKITGISRSQIEGKMASEVLPEIKNLEAYKNISENGGEFNLESYYASLNKWLAFYAFSTKKDEFTAIISDVTQQKEAEKELESERALFQGIFDTIPVMITIYDPGLKRFRFNKALKNTLGWTEEDATDGLFMERVYPNPVLRKEASDYMQSLEHGWREFPVAAKDGSLVPSQWVNIKLSDGVLIGIGIDLRQQKEADQKIKEISQRFLALADNIAQLAWMADARGEIFWYNKRWFDYTGTTMDEVKGYGWTKVQHPEYVGRVLKNYKNALQTGSAWEDTFPLRSREGSYNWFLSRALPITNDEGNITYWFGTNTDITDLLTVQENLKIAKEKAEENDKLKSAFLANVSHEIRTPMTGILGFTELLKSVCIGEDNKTAYLNIIESSGKRMLQIINDLIDISKIEAKQVEINHGPTNIPQLLNDLLLFFVPEANKKNIYLKLSCDLTQQFSTNNTDATKLSQILSNLIKNALKFTFHGTIEFGCTMENSSYKFFVKDTGPGISKANTEIIFERFRQGDVSWSDKSEGVGLGLSISKAYVELLGGKIYVDSEVGKGSIFYFNLPFLQSETNPDKIKKGEVKISFLSNKKVLIAEDEESLYFLLREILKNKGIQAIQAKDGREAVEIIKNNPDIDLIIMDSKMPNMAGYEATKIIRSFNQTVPIIALSAFSSDSDKQKALSIGCNEYLGKPMTTQALLESISRHLNIGN